MQIDHFEPGDRIQHTADPGRGWGIVERVDFDAPGNPIIVGAFWIGVRSTVTGSPDEFCYIPDKGDEVAMTRDPEVCGIVQSVEPVAAGQHSPLVLFRAGASRKAIYARGCDLTLVRRHRSGDL